MFVNRSEMEDKDTHQHKCNENKISVLQFEGCWWHHQDNRRTCVRYPIRLGQEDKLSI